jgi:MFS family permease
MLDGLRLDYLTFTVVNAAAVVGKVLSMPVWGRAADRFGARRVLGLTGFLMPLVPLLWLVSGTMGWLIAIQVYAGLIWGGFEVASFSFIFDTTSPQNRATCVAYYNMINGIALISGALLGALVVRMHLLFGSPFLFAFLLSGVLRLAASVWFVPHIKEVRLVEKIGYPQLFMKVISSMPTFGPVYALIPFRKKDEGKRQNVS